MGCSQVTVAACGLVDTSQHRLVRFGLVPELDHRLRVGLQRPPQSDAGCWVVVQGFSFVRGRDLNPRPSGYEPEITQPVDLGLCVKRYVAIGFLLLVLSRYYPSDRILSRDGHAMES